MSTINRARCHTGPTPPMGVFSVKLEKVGRGKDCVTHTRSDRTGQLAKERKLKEGVVRRDK